MLDIENLSPFSSSQLCSMREISSFLPAEILCASALLYEFLNTPPLAQQSVSCVLSFDLMTPTEQMKGSLASVEDGALI